MKPQENVWVELNSRPRCCHTELKRKAIYEFDIVVTSLSDLSCVVCFRDKVYSILNKKWATQKRGQSEDDIFEMAAVLVSNAIKLLHMKLMYFLL